MLAMRPKCQWFKPQDNAENYHLLGRSTVRTKFFTPVQSFHPSTRSSKNDYINQPLHSSRTPCTLQVPSTPKGAHTLSKVTKRIVRVVRRFVPLGSGSIRQRRGSESMDCACGQVCICVCGFTPSSSLLLRTLHNAYLPHVGMWPVCIADARASLSPNGRILPSGTNGNPFTLCGSSTTASKSWYLNGMNLITPANSSCRRDSRPKPYSDKLAYGRYTFKALT
jgi:hypothetical protein